MSLLNDTLRRLEERTGHRPDAASTVAAGSPVRSRRRWTRAAGPALAALAVAMLVALAFHHWMGPATVATPEPVTTPETPQPLNDDTTRPAIPAETTPPLTGQSAADAAGDSGLSGSGHSDSRSPGDSGATPAPNAFSTAPTGIPTGGAGLPRSITRAGPAQATGTFSGNSFEPEGPLATIEPRAAPSSPTRGAAADENNEVAKPEVRSETLLEQGRRLQQAGRWQASIGPFEEHLQTRPDHTEARLAIARALHRMDRPAAAVRVLEEGGDAHPGDVEYASALARAYLEAGNPNAARDVLARHPPEDLDTATRALLARTHQHMGAHAEAVHLYRSLATQSGEGRYWLGLAHSLEHLGESDPARDAYRRALHTGDLGPASRHHAEGRWEVLAGHREGNTE